MSVCVCVCVCVCVMKYFCAVSVRSDVNFMYCQKEKCWSCDQYMLRAYVAESISQFSETEVI